MYISKRILCSKNDSKLTDIQVMERYAQYFNANFLVSFSGCPSITMTQVNGSGVIPNLDIKTNTIDIDFGCYIESTELPAFPSGPTKLTCVALRDEKFGRIRIGKKCVLQGTSICSYNLVDIGDRVIFGPNVVIMDCSGHAIERRGNSDEWERLKISPVYIGDDAWLGYGVIVLPGVSIGKRAVIGAGSVVSKDIPDDCVAVGNPCIVKRLLIQ
ncbi:maltose acetyltransferase [Photobacterium phosphoreum]|uniref:DapH/DapD/GlmU-related protein n=1 Tax=Photobacterium phosphoreum TaxID=659 RepID=UPI0022B78C48|nr:DapH/DapD/GlmU-related protein [Photobacterium phosphoreum]MCD9462246.1 maltose acetyltransferase [Photobacterium phosphoreum]